MPLTEQLAGQRLKQLAWDLDELDRQIHNLEPQVHKRLDQINAGNVEPFDMSHLTTVVVAIRDALQASCVHLWVVERNHPISTNHFSSRSIASVKR